jgi:hypothetical protein
MMGNEQAQIPAEGLHDEPIRARTFSPSREERYGTLDNRIALRDALQVFESSALAVGSQRG